VKVRARQLGRALGLRCPLCGRRWPREGRLRLAVRCPTCDLQLERHENDFFLGAYTINLFATLIVGIVVALANVRWNSAPPALRYAISVLAITGFAAWFYPVSKLVWLVVDIQFRPPAEKDFQDPEDPVDAD
jgi:uncharacterized protein (DUF983 family)